eukprot:scaffold80410_cov51-Phaeocystis_antarctica.AAC.1
MPSGRGQSVAAAALLRPGWEGRSSRVHRGLPRASGWASRERWVAAWAATRHGTTPSHAGARQVADDRVCGSALDEVAPRAVEGAGVHAAVAPPEEVGEG